MRLLFFHSVFLNAGAATAVMHQAYNTLRPFNRFLQQAINTAKQRQTRYNLAWTRVRNLDELVLTPLDTRVRIPRVSPAWIVVNWPLGQVPDPSKPLMNITRSETVHADAVENTNAGLRLQTRAHFEATDQIFWCGIMCSLVREDEPVPPKTFSALDGTALPLRRAAEADGEEHWSAVIEGLYTETRLLSDRVPVDVELVPPTLDVKHYIDSSGEMFQPSGGVLRVEEHPADGLLVANHGVRFEWRAKSGRRGLWVQLLPPEEVGADAFLDPRAAFCEEDVQEVWTQPNHNRDTTMRVKRVDRDRYQLLLERLPDDDTRLYLPVDVRNLRLQQRALRQLSDGPLPHHAGLLRLCENTDKVRWPYFDPDSPSSWFGLAEGPSGTDEQRRFVAKALGTPDFAFLEGPPGSGKTTAICELIQQLVARGLRVLLCASTHVAIDNVLEKLIDSTDIDALRIGQLGRVDARVQACQLDQRIQLLVDGWREQPELASFGDGELNAMAERIIVASADLTCATTMGIINHPVFREQDRDNVDQRWGDRPIATMPQWDVLIVDEASKTLIQEFLVPALMAKKWIIVGDVRQLPPFADRADIVANIRELSDDKDPTIFAAERQRACLLGFRLARSKANRWLIVEPSGVLLALEREVKRLGERAPSLVRVTSELQLEDEIFALRLAAADWVLVSEEVLPRVASRLPSNLLHARELSEASCGLSKDQALFFRRAWARDRDSLRAEEAEQCDWLARHDLGGEVAWRLTRAYELRHSDNKQARQHLLEDLEDLLPDDDNIWERVKDIHDIGLPSILEVLQRGIGEQRSKRSSALTLGMPKHSKTAFEQRFERLSFQHRMHPKISEFSRKHFYQGSALHDANTIERRDRDLGWSFSDIFRSRRVFIDINGLERGGVNEGELRIIEAVLTRFLEWARAVHRPRRDRPNKWEVACLSFYLKQERAISEMLRGLTNDSGPNRFFRDGVELVCGTVDRFQGREADVVLISMRNTSRIGFLDSPNRLNVALTRARQQLIVVGNARYFRRCKIAELNALVDESEILDGQKWMGGRR